jgi:hypothetical protein
MKASIFSKGLGLARTHQDSSLFTAIQPQPLTPRRRHSASATHFHINAYPTPLHRGFFPRCVKAAAQVDQGTSQCHGEHATSQHIQRRCARKRLGLKAARGACHQPTQPTPLRAKTAGPRGSKRSCTRKPSSSTPTFRRQPRGKSLPQAPLAARNKEVSLRTHPP